MPPRDPDAPDWRRSAEVDRLIERIRPMRLAMTEIGLFDAIYSARALRRLKPDPVPEEIITRILDAAIRAPSAGNAQNWAFIVVRDPEQRRRLGVIYRKASDIASELYKARGRPAHMTEEQYRRFMTSGAYLWDHMGDAPVLLVPCLQARAVPAREALPPSLAAIYEQELAYERRIRGASIYPAVQNIILACRAFGLGTLITTNHIRCEDEVKAAARPAARRVDLCADADRLSGGEIRSARTQAGKRGGACGSLGRRVAELIDGPAFTGEAWRLKTARRLQKLEADPDRGEPHRLAADVAEPLFAGDRRAAAPGAGEMDEADRLRRRAAVRPGDSGDADRDLGARFLERALGHRPRGLTADGAVLGQCLGRNAEQLLLGGVGIGDKAALEHVGGTRDLRQKCGNKPAGAGFGGRDHPPGGAITSDERGGADDEVGRKHLGPQNWTRTPIVGAKLTR